MIKAVSVKVLTGRKILVDYEDGKQFVYDVSEDIQSIRGFNPLKSDDFFSKIYLTRGGRSIAWGDGDEFVDPDMSVEVPYSEGVQC